MASPPRAFIPTMTALDTSRASAEAGWCGIDSPRRSLFRRHQFYFLPYEVSHAVMIQIRLVSQDLLREVLVSGALVPVVDLAVQHVIPAGICSPGRW